jgi:PAS domain S-box-containing protein
MMPRLNRLISFETPVTTVTASARIAQLERELTLLRGGNQDLADFVENAPIGLHSVGADGSILWANRVELELLGYAPEEYIGRHVAEFHLDREVIQDILMRLKAGMTLRNQPARLRAKDGSVRHVLIDSNGMWRRDSLVHTRCFTRDVTAQVQAGLELRTAQHSILRNVEEARTREQLLRVALRGSPVVVFHQDVDLRYLWIYNPFAEHTGISLIDKRDSELFPEAEAEQLNRLKLGVLASGSGVRQEIGLTTLGRFRIMDTSIEPYWDASGKLAGLLGIAVDVTERKQNEQHLSGSLEQLRSLGAHFQLLREKERALTAREVDDIGQTLAALVLQLSMLTDQLAEGDKAKILAERLKTVYDLLAATVESSARISSELHPSLLDNLGLAVCLEWQAGKFAARTGIRLVIDNLDEVRLEPEVGIAVFRIIQEILMNVERHAQATEVRLSLRRKDDELTLEVSDNGNGITRNQLTDEKSLGLLGMRELANLFGGMIAICGIANQGTTVSLAIPSGARISPRTAGAGNA